MVFSSYLFLFYFLPAALVLYYVSPPRARHLILTIVSYVFSGSANPLFLFLLLFTTAVDYGAGLIIGRQRSGTMSGRQALRDRRARLALIVSLRTTLLL